MSAEQEAKAETSPPAEEVAESNDDQQMQEAAGDDGKAAGQKRKREDGGDAAEEPKEPVKLGFRTFTNVDEARVYFQHIVKTYKVNQDLNEVRQHPPTNHSLLASSHSLLSLSTPAGPLPRSTSSWRRWTCCRRATRAQPRRCALPPPCSST